MSNTLLMASASLIFVVEMVDAALSDLRKFQIPNRVPLILCAAFIAMAAFSGMNWTEFLSHLSSGLVLFILGLALYVSGIWGGGDAKLLPAVALWVGLVGQPRFLLVMAFSGGLLAACALLARHLPLKAFGGVHHWAENFVDSGQVPYGIAIAAAGLDWWVVSIIPHLAAKL